MDSRGQRTRGHGIGQRLRPHPALRRDQITQRGCPHGPLVHHGRLVRPHLQRLRLLRSGQADRPNSTTSSTREATENRDRRHQRHLRRPDPADPEVLSFKRRRGHTAHIRAFVERTITVAACPDCDGTRLDDAAGSSKVTGTSIADTWGMQINDWPRGPPGSTNPRSPPADADAPFARLVRGVGLGYLSLNRPSGTPQNGEAQPTKMFRHLGSALTDVTYVFDEPTVGLHPTTARG